MVTPRAVGYFLLPAVAAVNCCSAFQFQVPFTTSLPRNNHVRRSIISTNLSNSPNSYAFRKISNEVESSLATLQSVLFYGRLPDEMPSGMHPVPTQFIAALGDPAASSSPSGAEQWGIWRIDPGPRGIYVNDFQSNSSLASSNRRMPAGWKYNSEEFWIEEYGRVMETPDFPLAPGRYVVTGARQVTSLLTVGEPDENGKQSWKLEDGTLYDVTHLPCRSARYRPMKGEQERTPADANWSDYPVVPGGEMPAIEGCDKLDYAVLFVLAVDDR